MLEDQEDQEDQEGQEDQGDQEDQEDQHLFWQDKVETGLGCLKVGNKLAVHKSLQIFNSSQNTISSLVVNDSVHRFLKIQQKANSKDVGTAQHMIMQHCIAALVNYHILLGTSS